MFIRRPWTWLVCAAFVCLLSVVSRAQAPTDLPAVLAKPPAAPAQPLPYSHRQHLELGLVECVDCHVQPGAGPMMTFPATDTCMSCHATQPATTAALKELAGLAASGTPIPWVRVYRMPSYVYWSHASHLEAGVTCANCHGAVAENEAMRQETNVTTMTGCLACHEARQVHTDCADCHEPRQ